ncbi:biotin/lipoyl-binding protein [Novipirellula sp. SH528]|uniref:hypothetical protein n=1 Tax=Novipirellula sp. SH528 TaxID=3454466 RepID=UPI003F9FBA94
MSESLRRVEQTWKDAESLVRRADELAHAPIPASECFQTLAEGMRETAKARSVIIWYTKHDARHVLARSGIDVHQDSSSLLSSAIDRVDFAATSHWSDETQICVTAAKTANDTVVGIDMRWSESVDSATQQPIAEMSKAVLESATSVFIRDRNEYLQTELKRRKHWDHVVGQLHHGLGINDSFANVGCIVAKYVGVDRVSILYCRNRTHPAAASPPSRSAYRLISCSTSASIDSRSRLVRLMQDLAGKVSVHGQSMEFVVGRGGSVPDSLSEPLEAYMVESGCRAISMECLSLDHHNDSVVILFEQFTLPSSDPDEGRGSFADIREVVADALAQAIEQDEASLGTLIRKWCSVPFGKKAAAIALVVAVAALLMSLIHVDFWIPAEGRVVARQRRSVFAPADGVVIELPVDNGSPVTEGATLAVIRSHDLDTKQQQIEGEISALQTSLAAIVAGRGSSPSELRERNSSANEQVLKAKLEGLLLQLDLVTAQQQELVVRSPIAGKVDHWNMRENLVSRPIARGQFLAEVYSPEEGWELEIEAVDSDGGYLLQLNQEESRRCRFSLRSNPQEVYDATLTRVDNVTQLNVQGDWVIKGIVRPSEQNDAALDVPRTGAIARVEIWTGRRAVGFVWFRGLIEWFRSAI